MTQVSREGGRALKFGSKDLRNVLGAFPTGVTIVTTGGEDEPYGMTANAFTSVSLDPPLVLVCVNRRAQASELIPRNQAFAVNILTADQEPLSTYFASSSRARGREAFAEIPHRSVVTGSPVIEDAAAFLDCRLASRHEAGDHNIFVGEVVAIGLDPEAIPLVFHGGRYRSLIDARP